MILYIDTSDYNKAKFVLKNKKKTFTKSFKIDSHESFRTLGSLEEFLKKTKVDTDQLTSIVVCKGPGSFTGVRVGVTIAQALGLAWEVPVKFVAKNKKDKLSV